MRNLQELKVFLLSMHHKDVKQTIIALIVAEFITFLMVLLILFIIYERALQPPGFIWGVIALLLVGPSIPYLMMLYKATQRPGMIIYFIELMERGAVIQQVEIIQQYKFQLVIVQLYPVIYARITVGSDRQIFVFPVSKAYVAQFQSQISREISGVNGFSGISWSSN
ncbi:hypothetical protein CLV59_103484 [Chitinophaga dinghuensis]|uniref:DUF304 domain-containing protein n=1 Tax=Chitinophaga dinghuensis TaxID=1539050 RepID=A0A327W560_9BACT|nr:hypothetical protein [Chitinophaga dinghuensis]RAJ83516.1 hypothetical protein CLV59_103484 [Chitinophaga dinghuensis]